MNIFYMGVLPRESTTEGQLPFPSHYRGTDEPNR
jgi:hypothetical protein